MGGHELCGAIKAAQLPDETLEDMPSHLGQALKGLKAGLDLEGLKKLKDPRALDREAVTCNVKRQVETLCQDKSIGEGAERGVACRWRLLRALQRHRGLLLPEVRAGCVKSSRAPPRPLVGNSVHA